MAREDPQLKLRLTEEMKDIISNAARLAGRSVNAEIVARLEQSFENSIVLPPSLMARVARIAFQNGLTPKAQVIETLDENIPHGMSFGTFVETYALRAANAPTPAQRDARIREANQDGEARSSGFSLSEAADESGQVSVQINHKDEDGTESILGYFNVAAGVKER